MISHPGIGVPPIVHPISDFHPWTFASRLTSGATETEVRLGFDVAQK